METAIAIIKDEHRSLAMVIGGLRHVLQEACYKGTRPDFALLRSIQHYIRTFPEALHHPKEDAYLFRKLRLRTDATDEVIRELQRQHAESGQRLNELSRAIDLFETGAFGGLAAFAQAVERFAESQWQHMSLEEKVIFPAAQKHLTDKDWAEIAAAFGKNGDPRFGDEPNAEFRRLFTRITDLAPPQVVGLGIKRES
jgi:hemerythrin-like domain-containing protein